MTVKISGKNYQVSRLCTDFERALDKALLKFNVLRSAGSHPNSKVSIMYSLDNCRFVLDILKDPNVSVEIVDETLDTISRYLSEIGSDTFHNTLEFKESAYEYDEFEDFEMYYNRMQKMGVLL